ncbi:MAG: hypothetical protein ABW151_01805 [Pseudorhodoplanes sp.]
MLRIAGMIVLLICGAATAADLEIVPKPDREHRAAPPAPQPPVPLQTTQPPSAPQKERPPAAEQTPADTLHPPQDGPPSKDDSWWQKVVREAPNCKTFSDGCRTCNPNFACSGLPIACQPKEFTCVDPKPSGDKPSANKP